MITINLNAELFWLQLDPTCKDMPKTLSLGQYGMTRGVDRILEVLEERGIRATFFTPGWVAEQYPDKLKAIVEKATKLRRWDITMNIWHCYPKKSRKAPSKKESRPSKKYVALHRRDSVPRKAS